MLGGGIVIDGLGVLHFLSVFAPVVPIFCSFFAKNTTRFCAFIAHFGERRNSNDDFRETMISLVDLIVVLAVLVFCGGGCSVQILRDLARFPISPFGSRPFCRSHLT